MLLTFLFKPSPRTEAIVLLRQMSDRELSDIGIGRSEIPRFVGERTTCTRSM